MASDPSSPPLFKHGHLVAPDKPGIGSDVHWSG
jgi:L-alanine-DL-glutamate epimerase-like enolase superfamily enzyme